MKIFNSRSTKELRRKLRRNMTDAERVLWSKLRRKQLGYKFRRQHSIGKYIVDFYCPKAKLIIEVDGGVHSIDSVKESDEIREAYFKSFGFTIKRYWNSSVLNELESVLDDIYFFCDNLTSLDPSLGRREILAQTTSPLKIKGRLQRGLILKA